MSVLSIIIVSWNVREMLRECLLSTLKQQVDCDLEIIVVDNASIDGTVELIQSEFPQVHVIANQTNLGFARANNQGIETSQGDYILLLNPDTVLMPNSLMELKSYMDSDSKAGGCGAYLLNPDSSLQYSCSPEPTLKSEFLRLFHLPGIRADGYYEMADWNVSTPKQVDIILGACMFLRRFAIEQSGPMDENFFMYSEETDLCYRIRKAGWYLSWVPSAKVVHIGGQSTRQVASHMFIQLYRAKTQYFRKHKGDWHARMYKFIVAVSCLPRLGLFLLAMVEPDAKSQAHKNTARNYGKLLYHIPLL